MKNLPDFSNMDIYTNNSGVGVYPTPDNFLQKMLELKSEYEPYKSSNIIMNEDNKEDILHIKQSVDGEIESELIKYNTYSPHEDKNYISDYYKKFEYGSPIYDTSHIVKIRNC